MLVNRRRVMSDINVVPYIDVMLVLLIIFMITAPLITQGVRIDIPQAPSEVFTAISQEPVIVSLDLDGQLYIDIGDNPDKPVQSDTLVNRVAAVLKYKPDTDFLVAADAGVEYGRVIRLMTLVQSAGVDKVGLITKPPANQ
tara:strand:- start:65 stop:487 length:423 start_codon:yes stop_codon:yes gene_type:complete